MGSANFRTIGVDDIVQEGRVFGFLGKYSYGSNAIGPNFMGAIAGKTMLENNANLGILFAYSGQNVSQNYKIGGGGYIGDQKPPFDTDDDGIPDDNLAAPINPNNLYNQPRSQLFKVEYKSDISEAILNYRAYKNNLAGRKITNDTYQIDYRLNPDSNLLDLKFLFAYNDGKQKYNQGSTWGYHDMSGVKTKNRAVTFDLSNTMNKEFSQDSNLYFTYGVNILNNHYSNDFPQDRVLLPYILTSFYPKGKQDIKTLYLDTSFTKGIFTLNSNINWTNAQLSGYKGICSMANPYCQPKNATNLEKDYNNFNYSLMLSADIHPLFNPFISYSKSHRIPNVQEYFFTHDASFEHNMNTFLKAESADTYQIGFNSFTHEILNDSDTLGFKMLYYDTKVKNYIYNRRYWQKADDAIFLMQLNDDEKAKFHGVELEFKYDTGFFYSILSYTYQKSKHKFSDTESLEFGGAQSGQSQFAQLPEHYANLDMGVRLFEEKLTLGALAKYTGKAKRIVPVGSLDNDPSNPDAMAPLKTTDELPKIPTIVDLYANYKILKNFTIKAEVPKIELSLSSLYQNADEVVKGVIYILVLFSVLAWAVFISKLMQFYFMEKNLDFSIHKIKELKNLNELDQTKGFAGVLSLEIQDELEKSEYKNDHIKERIELRLQNTISKQITASKNGLSLLASIGASAPFIGLFGTVWGIMNAFIGIANLGNASLAVVAPGIAEALFATAFGLIAAIPAVLFYNYLTRKNLKLMHHLDELANFVYILFHRSYFNDKN
ncbi:TonB-dependent receptor domain-containing protein [Campylobacter coli]